MRPLMQVRRLNDGWTVCTSGKTDRPTVRPSVRPSNRATGDSDDRCVAAPAAQEGEIRELVSLFVSSIRPHGVLH